MSLGRRRKPVARRSLRKNGEQDGYALFSAPMLSHASPFPSSPYMTSSYNPNATTLDLFQQSGTPDTTNKLFFVPYLMRTGKHTHSSSDRDHDKDSGREDRTERDMKDDHDEDANDYQDDPDRNDDDLEHPFDSDDSGDDMLDTKMDTSSQESDTEVAPKKGTRNNGHSKENGKEEKHEERVQVRSIPSSRSRRSAARESEDDDDDEDEEDASVIRCACGNNVDFGLMIQCEKCDVWQHAGCVGLKSASAIPSHYYCERCKPRPFNCSCNKKDPSGKMIICTQCNMFQHLQCVPNPRDPHVCFRCINKSSSSSRSHAASPTPALTSDGGRGKRGRKPTPRQITPPRQPQHKHETRSNTSALQTGQSQTTPSQVPSQDSTPNNQRQKRPGSQRGSQKATRSSANSTQSPHSPPSPESPRSPLLKPHKLEKEPAREQSTPSQPIPPKTEKEHPEASQSQFHNTVNNLPPTPTLATPPSTPPTPPPTTPPTPTLCPLYDFITDPALCKTFESDHAYLVENNYSIADMGAEVSEGKTSKSKYIKKKKNGKHSDSAGNGTGSTLKLLSFPERMLLAKYAAEYCKALPSQRASILQGVGTLLGISSAEAKEHMRAMAKEFASITSSASARTTDTNWTELSENICSKVQVPTGSLCTWREGTSGGSEMALEDASNTTGIVVKRSANKGALVAEYRGTVVPREVLCKEWQSNSAHQYLCRPPSPFVLFPPLASTYGVDARNSGSNARFVRRSCSPNAEVSVLWDKEKPRFAILAKEHVALRTEVTIPFDCPWRIVTSRLSCPCDDKACEVEKWFDERHDLGVKLQRLLVSDVEYSQSEEEDSRASQPPTPDLDQSPSPSPSITPNSAAPSSDDESHTPTGRRRRTSGVRMLESTLNPFTPPVNRPSREQRKLQALVKTFEKLEHREKRKKDDTSTSPLPSPSPSPSISTGLDRKWKRKKAVEHTPVSPESTDSPSVSSPEFDDSATVHSTQPSITLKTEEERPNGNAWRRRYTRKRPLSPSRALIPSTSPVESPHSPSREQERTAAHTLASSNDTR